MKSENKYKDFEDLETSYMVIKEKLLDFISWTDRAFYNWTPRQKYLLIDRIQDVITNTINENVPEGEAIEIEIRKR